MVEMERLKDRHFINSTFKPSKKVIRELLSIEYAELERLRAERAKKDKESNDWIYYDVLIESKLHDIEWYKYFNKKEIKNNFLIKKEDMLNVPISRFVDFKGEFAKCIFHNEKSPSMKLYPATNTIHCFGCGKTANAIQCMQQVRGCDFQIALQELAKLL